MVLGLLTVDARLRVISEFLSLSTKLGLGPVVHVEMAEMDSWVLALKQLALRQEIDDWALTLEKHIVHGCVRSKASGCRSHSAS